MKTIKSCLFSLLMGTVIVAGITTIVLLIYNLVMFLIKNFGADTTKIISVFSVAIVFVSAIVYLTLNNEDEE